MAINSNDIRFAKNGDADAFSRLYNETVKTAYFVAKRILVNEGEEAIEDVLQDAYVAVYTNIHTFSTGNFQGWVDVIVANRAKNYLKKKKPTLFTELESEDEDAPELQFEDEKIEFRPDEQVDYAETKRLIMEIIDSLSEEQRTAVVLYYFDEISIKDIAAACECSENTIKSRLNYARKNIKEKVEELEKKGTKLYCFPLIPFLFWLLKEEFKTTTVWAAVIDNTSEAIMSATRGGSVKTVKKSGLSLANKILLGVAGAAIITGAAIGVKSLIGGGDKEETSVQVSANNINSSSTEKTQETTEEVKEEALEEVTDSFTENDTEMLKYLACKISMYTIDKYENTEIESDNIYPSKKVDIFYAVMTLADFKDFDSLETLGYATETTYKDNNAYLMTADNLAKAIAAIFGTVVPENKRDIYYEPYMTSDGEYVIHEIEDAAGAVPSGDGYILNERSGVEKMYAGLQISSIHFGKQNRENKIKKNY